MIDFLTDKSVMFYMVEEDLTLEEISYFVGFNAFQQLVDDVGAWHACSLVAIDIVHEVEDMKNNE